MAAQSNAHTAHPQNANNFIGLADRTPKTFPPGYPALAGKMAQYPQLGIVRRFTGLAARNLLYYQAELKCLEHDLIMLEIRDSQNKDSNFEDFSGNWQSLSEAKPPGDQQWQKMLEIRSKIKEYYDFLIQASTIAKMEDPASYDLKFIQDYLETEAMGPTWLFGKDSSTWGSKEHRDMHATDLVSIKPPLKKDAFSSLFIHRFVDLLFKYKWPARKKPSKTTGDVVYEQDSLLRITHSITCFVASIPPLLAIVILSYITAFKFKIAMLVVCNLLLAICLTIFTNATRAEVFGVTAAFDAITVVFVGSNQTTSLSGCKANQH